MYSIKSNLLGNLFLKICTSAYVKASCLQFQVLPTVHSNKYSSVLSVLLVGITLSVSQYSLSSQTVAWNLHFCKRSPQDVLVGQPAKTMLRRDTLVLLDNVFVTVSEFWLTILFILIRYRQTIRNSSQNYLYHIIMLVLEPANSTAFKNKCVFFFNKKQS